MPKAPLPADEDARLEALRAYGILDTPPEKQVDDLVQLAATICGTPMAIVSLLDTNRQWFKARVGLDACETPRDQAFCGYAILGDEPLIVENAAEDPRFADNELVSGEMHLRFYAGIPLRNAEGHAFGTLCVLDTEPRTIPPEKVAALRILARAVLDQIELRRQIAEAETQRAAREATQKHFDRLFSLSLDLFCVASTDGYFKEINPAFEETLGHSRDILLTTPFLDFVHPADQAKTIREMESLAEGLRTSSFENRYRCADASYRWLSWRAYPIPEDGLIYAVARDVTEEKVTQELLRQTTAFQNAVLDAANYSIISTEIDGTIRVFNSTAERWLGFHAAEMIGLQTPQAFHDLDEVVARTHLLNQELGLELEPGFETFVAKVKRGGIDEQEWTYVRKNGSRFPVHLSITAVRDQRGEIMGFLGVASDLTEKKQAAERERRLLEILEATPDFIGITDPGGKVLYINSSGRLRLGLSAESDLSRTTVADLHPEDAAEMLREQAFPIAARDGLWTGEIPFRDVHGEDIPFSMILVAHRRPGESDDSAEVRFYSILARDITETKRYQAELAEARDAAIEASRLKSQFLANMSHELRTPLNSIIGFSELLMDRVPGPLTEDQEQCVLDVFESGKHLLALINDILDLSKIEAGKMEIRLESVDLAPLVDSVLSTLLPLAQKKEIELDREIDPAAPPIWADPGKVRQVLNNLLSNAIKFTEEGSVMVRVRAEPDRHRVAVDVQDTGIGISGEDLAVIFDEFRQVDGSHTRKHEGSGLGLALSRNFLRLMGGEITVRSNVGQGSTFTFLLPMAIRPEVEGNDTPLLHSGHVLLIEDDPRSAELARKILESADFLVTTATTGPEGLRLARELHPDALITDVLLPGKSGWDILAEVKSDPQTCDIPLILLSVINDPQRGHALGAVHCLVKPIDRRSLIEAVRRSLGLKGQLEGQKVLVVDDEPAVLRLGRSILEEAGARALVAGGGREGVEIARAEKPDLLILDLMMPEVTGFDVVDALAEDESTRNIPILILTAKDLTPEDWARLNGHICRLVQKGAFRARDLVRAVEEILNDRE